MELQFKRAVEEDAETMILVHDQAFYEDFLTYGECPGYHRTRESMLKTIRECNAYVIYDKDTPVANVSVRELGNRTYYIGSLCVIPEYQHLGIGQRVLRKVRELFPQAECFTLKTPADKVRNVEFYQRQGFEIVSEELDGHVKVVDFELRPKQV